jgi:LysR family hydrogen peroxide-inducible transcriptional activator
MQLAQLEYLKALRFSGGFSSAAQKLGITQPALTLQIQKLEEELGFKLIDRSKRPLQFTREGEIFFQKSVEILQMVEQLKQVSLEMSEEVQGELKVGIIPTLAPYLVPLFINALAAGFPNLSVDISELKTEEIISRLKAGTLDSGIISTPVIANGLLFEPLFYERFFVYVSENHRFFEQTEIALAEIDEDEIWYLEEGNCFQNQVNSMCMFNLQQTTQNLVYRSSSIESLRRIVEKEKGLTFIPELATINIPAEQEDLVKTIAGEQPVREISMAVLKNFPKERQVEALKTVILKSIPRRMLAKPAVQVVDPKLKIS